MTVPDKIEPKGASDRVVAALNGSSYGSTSTWDYSPGDYLLAEVRGEGTYRDRFAQRVTPRFVLLVIEGTEAGKKLPEHCHRVLPCQHQELRNMAAELSPKVGDVLTVYYIGRDDRPGYKSRHLFRYSVERHGETGSDGHEF